MIPFMYIVLLISKEMDTTEQLNWCKLSRNGQIEIDSKGYQVIGPWKKVRDMRTKCLFERMKKFGNSSKTWIIRLEGLF